MDRNNIMTAEALNQIFDDGEADILPYLDLAKAVRPGHPATLNLRQSLHFTG